MSDLTPDLTEEERLQAEILNEPGESGTAWANIARRLATAEVALEAAEAQRDNWERMYREQRAVNEGLRAALAGVAPPEEQP